MTAVTLPASRHRSVDSKSGTVDPG